MKDRSWFCRIIIEDKNFPEKKHHTFEFGEIISEEWVPIKAKIFAS